MHPQKWKCRVLITGLPRKALPTILKCHLLNPLLIVPANRFNHRVSQGPTRQVLMSSLYKRENPNPAATSHPPPRNWKLNHLAKVTEAVRTGIQGKSKTWLF